MSDNILNDGEELSELLDANRGLPCKVCGKPEMNKMDGRILARCTELACRTHELNAGLVRLPSLR